VGKVYTYGEKITKVKHHTVKDSWVNCPWNCDIFGSVRRL